MPDNLSAWRTGPFRFYGETNVNKMEMGRGKKSRAKLLKGGDPII